jgi:hypothetical protein
MGTGADEEYVARLASQPASNNPAADSNTHIRRFRTGIATGISLSKSCRISSHPRSSHSWKGCSFLSCILR